MNASIFILAAALNAGNAEFDRVAAEGAARITLDRFAASLAREGLPQGVPRTGREGNRKRSARRYGRTRRKALSATRPMPCAKD